MKYPLAALFFRFDQAQIFEREHVLLHPLDLLAAHAPALDVHRDTGQMGRCSLASFGRRIAVVSPELLLDLNRAHCGIDLDLVTKLFVVGLTQIFQKVTCPGTAIAAVGIKPGVES